MAYLRTDTENLEVSYPAEKVWAVLPKAVKRLKWKIQEKDDQNFKAKVQTKGAFLSYASTLQIEAKIVNENTTRMTINAETPVTTITSMVDVGRTRNRIDDLIAELAHLLNDKKA